MAMLPETGLLVEAEAFDDFGGWVMDSQFESEMGSPYLLAHGNGTPVADATTKMHLTEAGEYNIWVRAKDWVPGHHPGRFVVLINGKDMGVEFGANNEDWNWQLGARKYFPIGDLTLSLHDLTGFGGRCDAILFTQNHDAPPGAKDEDARAWRKRIRGIPNEPVDKGHFDVVVVGAGIPGIAAALNAARLGERTALIHARPFLGGNASLEIGGLRPRGITGPVIDEIYDRGPDGDLVAARLLSEAHVSVFLEHTVFATVTVDNTILSVDAREARSGREFRFSAPVFIDCSGTAIVGLASGAETLFGQESQSEYSESLAPENGDNMHHGNTVFFRTRMASLPVAFPLVPWATEIAKDFSDLRGQLIRPGMENGPGPVILPEGYADDAKIPRRMKGPFTHFWEFGQWLDPYTQAEQIRDHLLRAIYGTFSNVKTAEPERYANLALDWVAHVPAQGQFKRYKGDYVLTETDIRTHKVFDDAVVQNGGAFCLHYAGNDKYDFRLQNWKWDERDGNPYDIPFRSLYSRNISNLMMAGKHISVTHVAGSNTKFMGNGGQHAIATAAAAHLCNKYKTDPRGICQDHIRELQDIAAAITKGGLIGPTAKSKL